MTLTLDVSQDYLVFDNYETVSLTGARTTVASGGNVTIADLQALRRALRAGERSPSQGVYQGFELNWLVPRLALTTDLVPEPRDTILDADGNTWTVLTAEFLTWRTMWKLGCVNLVIAAQLYDLVNVEQSGTSYDAAGAAVRGWPSGPIVGGTTLAAALPCRVQPQEQVLEDRAGIRGGQVNYLIYLSKQLTLPNLREIRVVFGTGAAQQIFDVVKYERPQLITDLPALQVELRP